MKAWLLDSLSGIDTVRLAEIPEPKPAAGEVLLDLDFAALNPADRYLAAGEYPAKPAMPHILGRDGVGIARECGEGVTGIQTGQHYLILRGEVGVSRAGTFAQRVLVPQESLAPIPAGWPLEQASCASLVYLTAYQALSQWGDLPPSVVLVTGASGGVGVASLQLGTAMGHTVIALSRNRRKRDELEKIGAAATFDPQESGWAKQMKLFLKGRRVDLAIDNIGGSLFSEVVETLGNNGRISVVGRLAGPVPEFNTASLFFRRLRIGGVAVGSYSPAESQAAWQLILQLLNRSGARPLIDQIFTLERLKEAFARLAEGPLGKVLISIR